MAAGEGEDGDCGGEVETGHEVKSIRVRFVADYETAVVLRTMPTSQKRDVGHPDWWLFRILTGGSLRTISGRRFEEGYGLHPLHVVKGGRAADGLAGGDVSRDSGLGGDDDVIADDAVAYDADLSGEDD